MILKESLKSLEFFSTLDDAQIDNICAISSVNTYTSGYVLYYENQNSTHLQFLVNGLAKAYKIDKNENEIFLYHITKDSILSEITDFKSNSLNTFSNLMLQEESIVISIDYKRFKAQYLDKQMLCVELASEVLKRSLKMQDLLNREFIFDAVSKVAMMLDTDLNIFNKIKRHDISLMLHIQPATLSRVLNRLKRNNIIGIMQGKVDVLDKEALRDIYDEEVL